VFVLVLAVVSGLPLLIAHVAPGTVEAIMPLWGVILWGWSLVLGSIVTLVAMTRQNTNGIIAEQVGSIIVGFSTVIYGACIALVGGAEASLAASITIGFGFSCFYRWLQLQSLLAQGQHVVDAVRRGDDVTLVEDVDLQDQKDITTSRARRRAL